MPFLSLFNSVKSWTKMGQNTCYEIEPLIFNYYKISKGTLISPAVTNPICFNEEKNRPSIVSGPDCSAQLILVFRLVLMKWKLVLLKESESRYWVIYEKSVLKIRKKTLTSSYKDREFVVGEFSFTVKIWTIAELVPFLYTSLACVCVCMSFFFCWWLKFLKHITILTELDVLKSCWSW